MNMSDLLLLFKIQASTSVANFLVKGGLMTRFFSKICVLALMSILFVSADSRVLAENGADFASVTTLAGAGTPGAQDGVGKLALLNRPHGMAQNNSGIVYFADRGNHQIRSFNPATLEVKTVAGSGKAGSLDSKGREAEFNQPIAVAVSREGIVYVADRENHKIRKIDAEGNVTTLAGTGLVGNADGNALEAQFNQPYGVALDQEEENLLVADYLNHSVRSINLKTALVTTLAGNGQAGNFDGEGRDARFNQPYSIKHDGQGNFYIPDQLNHSIRKLTLSGQVTTVAGSGKAGYADGSGSSAQFNNPTGLAVGVSGELYVADRNNHRIRRVSQDGTVTTLAGTGVEGDKDGSLAEAEFKRPIDVVYDAVLDELTVSEENGHRLRNIK